MGAKLIPNDQKTMGEFETLCAFHTPIMDIAEQMNVSIDELKQWIYKTYKQDSGRVYQRFMRKGEGILNRSSLKLAEKNAYMNIWLRKQWLKEKDPDKQGETVTQDVEDWTPISEMLKDDTDK